MDFSGLHFGDACAGGDRDGDGMIDEVAIWDRALSTMDVIELYHRGAPALGTIEDISEANKIFVGVLSATPALGSVSGTGIYDLNSLASISSSGSLGYSMSAWTANFGPDLSDADGLTAYDELVIYGTLPGNPDSDGDGIPDGTEVYETQTNPAVSDSVLIASAGLASTNILTNPWFEIEDAGAVGNAAAWSSTHDTHIA